MLQNILKLITKSIAIVSLVLALSTIFVSIPASAQAVAQQAPTGITAGTAPRPATTTGTNKLTPDVCSGSCPLTGSSNIGATLGSKKGLSDFILNVAKFLTYIAAAIAVVFMVWGAYNWMNVADPKGAETGQKIVTNAAIGLAIAILAYTIVSLIGNTLQGNLLGGLVTGQ